jgi:DNA-directed RNA polymerase subunit K/omega
MPAKKNTKTLFTKTNPVDISSLLTNSNINNNLHLQPFQMQTGGRKTHKSHGKKTKKNKDSDSDSDSDLDSASDADSDTLGQFGKGKKNDGEIEEEEEEEEEQEEEIEEEPDENDELNEGIEEDTKVTEENDEGEENDEADNADDAKSVVSDNDDADDDKETLDTNNKCYSKYAKEDDFDLDEYFKDDDIVITKTGRVGKPILFKYEKVRLLSDRSRQLAEGAKPMIKNTVGLSHKEIALLELKNKLIPLIIERPIPNAGCERWRLSELEIPEYD